MSTSGLNKQLRQEMTDALKMGQAEVLSVLRVLISAIRNVEIDRHGDLSDEEIIQIIKRQIKQRLDAIDIYLKGERSDLVAKERREIEILNKYIPRQLEVSEIEEKVKNIVEKMPGDQQNNFGLVMKRVMAELKGNTDGTTVAKVVKKALSG